MVGALLSLHGRSASPTSVSLGIAHVSSRQQLIDIVGVLRRPQTPAYRPQQLLSQVGRPRPALLGGPDLPLVRYVASTPWGERLYFVPMKPPTRAQIESIARQLHVTRAELAGGRRETLAVFSAGGGGGGGGGAGDAAAIEAGQGIVTQGTGDLTRITVVVPDGSSG